VSKIQVFDFDIVYKIGRENLVADKLSRKLDSDATLCAISIVIPEWISEVQIEYVKNLEIRKLIEEVESNPTTNPKFTWENDILWYKQRIFLPNSSKFKIQVLKENHVSLIVGHVGFFKTYYNICQSFFWKGMQSEIRKYVVECDTFQWKKFETITPLDLLQPLHVPVQKLSEISMDFITGLPTYKGKDVILVIVDRLTKYTHFFLISSKSKASQVVDSYVKNIFKLHGFPKVIVSDKDPNFTRKFWK